MRDLILRRLLFAYIRAVCATPLPWRWERGTAPRGDWPSPMITLPLGSFRPCDERGGSGLHARCPSLAKRSEGGPPCLRAASKEKEGSFVTTRPCAKSAADPREQAVPPWGLGVRGEVRRLADARLRGLTRPWSLGTSGLGNQRRTVWRSPRSTWRSTASS